MEQINIGSRGVALMNSNTLRSIKGNRTNKNFGVSFNSFAFIIRRKSHYIHVQSADFPYSFLL